MKNLLIINGHPDPESFCHALAERYDTGARQSGAKVELVHLADLSFDPILRYGYRQRTELEPDLLNMQAKIKAADHLVWVYPNWWGTFPALMKGFIDRVFLPGYAFSYRENSPLWDTLLTGKTGRLMVTMDTPPWYYRFVFRAPGHHAMKQCILGFCGIKNVKTVVFAPLKRSSSAQRELWLQRAERLGREMG